MEPLEASPFLLPQELLEEIFQHLDIESILSLRLTCKTCYTATMSVWRYLAREIQSKPQNPRSEEPLEDYTTEELRDWVLRHHRAEQVWNTSSNTSIRMRSTKTVIRHPTVLPGGRWFLSMNLQDEIMVVDMDSPQLKSTLLIKVNRYIEGTDIDDRPGKFTVWVDPCAPRLSFRIALINPGFQRYSNAEGRSRVHVFHAYLFGHGEGATLIAEPFRRFEGLFPGSAGIEAMNGRYFIQVKEVVEGEYGGAVRFDLHVFDCKEGFFTKVRLCGIECPTIVDIFIPSDDRITIVDMQSIYVYAIPTPSTTPGSKWSPIHAVSIGWAPPFAHRSKSFTGETSTAIMCLQGGDLIVLRVPHDMTEEHSVTRIAAFPTRMAEWRTVNLSNALEYQANSGRSFLRFLKYPWDPLSAEGPPRDVHISSHEVDIPSNIFPSGLLFFGAHSFHSSTGRLVMISRVEDLLHVYDLVPAPRGSGVTLDN